MLYFHVILFCSEFELRVSHDRTINNSSNHVIFFNSEYHGTDKKELYNLFYKTFPFTIQVNSILWFSFKSFMYYWIEWSDNNDYTEVISVDKI